MSEVYDPAYYDDLAESARTSAEVGVPVLLDLLSSRPQSVVDVGCGSGEWLAAFRSSGISDIVGIDGPWVPQDALSIPRDDFVVANLADDVRAPLRLGRRFDLVVSLEVAEHLPARCAAPFVQTLTDLGDLVLFSAAVPDQGGRDHQNERWPGYWAELFEEHGFHAVDALRPRLWNETSIAWWYRQNVLLFANAASLNRQPALRAFQTDTPAGLVHAGRFLDIRDGLQERLRGYEEWVDWLETREADLEQRANELAQWGERLESDLRAARNVEPGQVSLRRAVMALPGLLRYAIRQRLGRP